MATKVQKLRLGIAIFSILLSTGIAQCQYIPSAEPPAGPMLPITTTPIIYAIGGGGCRSFTIPHFMDKFNTVRPDVLHCDSDLPFSSYFGAPLSIWPDETGVIDVYGKPFLTLEEAEKRIKIIKRAKN